METELSERDELWNACVDKSCCRHTRVPVTGNSLARLVSALELPALSIVTAVRLPPPHDGLGFRLRWGGPAFELVLRKRGKVDSAGAPCVFLVETSDRHALCGAGAVRPTSCQAFPAVSAGSKVRVIDAWCRCHAWSKRNIGEAQRTSAQMAEAEVADDRLVIHAWNSRLSASGPRRSLEEFCEHLLAQQRNAI